MKTDISFYLPSFQIGGAERVSINLANAFTVRGYKVDLVTPNLKGRLRSEVNKDINVVKIKSYSFPPYSQMGVVPFLTKYLEENSPTWLYTAMNQVNIPSLIAWKLADTSTKIVISEHTDPIVASDMSIKNWVLYKLAIKIYPLASEIVTVSEGAAQSLSEISHIPKGDITAIYNPIDSKILQSKSKENVDHEWFNSSDIDVVLGVGRLSEQKRFSDLVVAFDHINSKERIKLVIIGDGSDREQIESEIRDRGLINQIELLGYKKNPYKYMRQASVTVLPSEREGFGNVIVEAMACGCPVVATNCKSGPEEILCGGKYGKLVPVGNTGMLSKAISETLSDPIDEKQLKSRASDFHVNESIERYEEVLFNK